jgi:hypothetical protein|tara:strand:- start:7798 stop:8532 length:735 start_codon:yes stop_codon:yes gene_type:complete
MTLLTIADAVADETKGPKPATIASNTDPAAENILRLINKVGKRLQKAYAWNILTKEHSFTAPGVETLLSAAAIAAIGDFGRIIPETFWDRGSNNLISGPIDAVEWQGLKVQTYSSQNKKYRYRGGDIITSPRIDSGVTCAFEYVSINWCDIAAGSGEKAAFTIDTDVALIDEELIIYGSVFEWLDNEGQPSGNAARKYKDHFDLLIKADNMNAKVLTAGDIFSQNTRHFTGDPKASRASYGGDF